LIGDREAAPSLIATGYTELTAMERTVA
jgi:hypothetical protein